MNKKKINIGTANPVKIKAVKETCNLFDQLKNFQIEGIETESGVSEQPMTLEETVTGALNRAKNVFNNCDISIGIEGGLIEVSHTLSGYMNTSACVIWDGENSYYGLSPSFETPKRVIDTVIKEKTDISNAYHLCGLTEDQDIGTSCGAIGILSDNVISRKDYIMMGLNLAFFKFFSQ